MGDPEPWPPKRKPMLNRDPRLVVATGVFGLIGVLIVGVAGYWRYANQLPVYPAPQAVMPAANAYEDFVAAGHMCYAVGGATVPAAPAPPSAAPQQPVSAAATGIPGAPGDAPNGEQYMSTSGGPPGGPSAAPQQREAFEPGVPLAQVRAVVARNRPALARLRRGFRKRYRNPPVVSFNQHIPEPARCRALARVLATEGKLAEREGRPNDAMRSYLDCLRLGTELPRGGVMIHGLAGIAIQQIGLHRIQEAADRLNGPTAAAAAREMVRLDARAPSAAETFAGEKEAMTAEVLEMLRRPEVRGQLWDSSNDWLPPWFILWISVTPKRLMLDHIRNYMDSLAADSRRPYYAQPAAPPIPNDPLCQLLLPVFDQAQFKWDLRDAQWRITEARLALRAYKLQHGAPPASLAALVPDYLPAVPQDPFAPKPLVYRHTSTGVLIYSRGPDGKDDGGKDMGPRVTPDSRGDIVSMKSRN